MGGLLVVVWWCGKGGGSELCQGWNEGLVEDSCYLIAHRSRYRARVRARVCACVCACICACICAWVRRRRTDGGKVWV